MSGIASPRPPRRILVIEDDAPTRELLADVLSADGHEVVLESSGVAGRDRAISEHFDLILSDIGLPDLDGVAVAQQLRAAGVRSPLLALSGYAAESDRELGRAAGFDEYLLKPIRASTLRTEVARQLARPAAAPLRADPAAAAGRLPVAGTAVAPVVPVRRRGVLGGRVVVAMGIPFILQPLGVPNAASYLFVAMGGAFLISYLRGHQYVYLIPMVTLTSFGVALLLPTWIVLRPEAVAPAFVGIIALGFLVAFGLAPDRRWPLIPAGLLGIVSAARLVTGWSPVPGPLEPFLVPFVLVAVGLYLLVEKPG
jgi:CheY-like chemotaxis protein